MKKLQEYLKEVIQELRKVSWPGKEELKGSTTVVIFFSVVMAVFVWGVDFLLSELFKMVIR
jgi:preprotein translocase subunit SecE